MKYKAILFTLLIFLLSLAQARVTFELLPFEASSFRDYDKIVESCAAPAASSFWCEHLDESLSFISTKSVDYFFNSSGEVVGLYSKQQKGQDFSTKEGYRHGIDSGQNLISATATIPGGAILLDGEYLKPENVEANWEQLNEIEYEGTFSFTLNDIEIKKTITVSNISHIAVVLVEANRIEATDTEAASGVTVVQYALPGIAKANNPVFKIGEGDNSSLNPISVPVNNANYISVQSGARPTTNSTALILRPSTVSPETSAQYFAPNIIALQKELGAEVGSSLELNAEQYGGQNELVRYYQEGYKDLPGLFKPNILGQLSLGILWFLQRIHNVVGGWGLAIIVLTLFFRALIWPLISTQTKSMYAMQKLQPKLQALQKKHKDDREKLTQETMKLYKDEKVNPAGGCLPVILQMPLFIILWRVFANFEFNEGFLWIPDLGQPDPLYILPILYLGVIFAQSYFMAQGNKQSLQQQLLMNAVFIFFIISFPTGVTLYYVVSMLVQVFQYWLIRRSQNNAAKPATA